MTATELAPKDRLRIAENDRRAAEARGWLAGLGTLPTADELVGPIISALLPLHDPREQVAEHVFLLEHAEFVETTDAERAAAERLLSLQREIADLLAVELTWWVAGRSRPLGEAMRSVLHDAMNTPELVHGCRWKNHDDLRLG